MEGDNLDNSLQNEDHHEAGVQVLECLLKLRTHHIVARGQHESIEKDRRQDEPLELLAASDIDAKLSEFVRGKVKLRELWRNLESEQLGQQVDSLHAS